MNSMIEYLNREFDALIAILNHPEGKKILEEQDRITEECFKELEERYDLTPFKGLL